MENKHVYENTLIPMTIDIVNEYTDEITNDRHGLLSLMGSQATYLYNMCAITLKNADVSAKHEIMLSECMKKMENIIQGASEELGLTEPKEEDEDEDEDEDDDDEVSYEDVQEFAKECKLNKTETAVLWKIVNGNGHPDDMTEKDIKVAIKMKEKIEGAGKKLGFI